MDPLVTPLTSECNCSSGGVPGCPDGADDAAVVKIKSPDVASRPDESRDITWQWYVVAAARPARVTVCDVTNDGFKILNDPYDVLSPYATSESPPLLVVQLIVAPDAVIAVVAVPLIVMGTTAGAALTVPPEPVTTTASPAGEAPRLSLIVTGASLLPDRVTDTVAITPFGTVFGVKPHVTHL
jgi:hypothetical protein